MVLVAVQRVGVSALGNHRDDLGEERRRVQVVGVGSFAMLYIPLHLLQMLRGVK